MNGRGWEYAALAAVIIVGLTLGVLMFLAPHNSIADEEVYLDQVFSLFSGQLLGWNVRAYFYPLLLTPAKYLAAAFGYADPISVTFAVRTANYLLAMLGVYWCYQLAARLFDVRVALMAVALLVGSAYWQLDATRLMMDVPAATWLLGAAVVVAGGMQRRFAGSAVMVLCALAVFTKYQVAPAALVIALWALFDRSASGIRLRVLRQLSFAGLVMLFAFSIVEFATYGYPFASVINLYHGVVSVGSYYVDKYGACQSPWFYLVEVTTVYSFLVPPLVLAGVVRALWSRHRGLSLVLIVLAYITVASLICHKEFRYYLEVTPFLLILAASGMGGILAVAESLPFYPRRGALVALLPLFILVPTWLSLLPRNPMLAALGADEACPAFVYSTAASGVLDASREVALGVPCGMPRFYLRPYRVVSIDGGIDDQTRISEQRLLRKALQSGDLHQVFVARDSWIERDILDFWSSRAVMVSESAHGKYRLWRLVPTPLGVTP